MCGIAGFVGSGDRGVLERMTGRIAHRGPDADGFGIDERDRVFLGHRRLAIVDLAGGAQPMWSADGEIGVIFNGEIYNHADLRADLKRAGCQFQTDHSDTEVLLHAYREWGDGFVARLNGMFAFVIYDRLKRRLFGSRDRFGKKPFYYFKEGSDFGWASELSALLEHPSCPRSLSPLSLQKYFAYCFIPAPRSIIERVWKLPGGYSLSLDLQSGELKTWRWWQFILEPKSELEQINPNSKAGNARIDLLCEEIRETLSRAVQRRLMSDVPLGVFLSGGIDSSAVAAFAAKHVPSGSLATFSIGFNEASFDESKWAQLMARELGTKHHHEVLNLDGAIALLPDIVSQLDEPLGDGSLLPTYLLARFARKQVTVALGGDGGDELFAGYDPLRALKPANMYARLMPRLLHSAVRVMAARLPVSHKNLSWDFKVKRTLSGLSYPRELWNSVWMGAVEPADMPNLFRGASHTEEIYSEAIEAWDDCAQPNIVDRSLQWWTNLYLQNGILAKVDRASMICSLEARSPFLDLEFADLARQIPSGLKLRGGETKWILKRALRSVIPDAVIDRPKKGFGMPIGRWLREKRFSFDEPCPAMIDRGFVERKVADHLGNRSDERLFLWSYWLLIQWLRR
jgi:asparagine synthase (glutamine-hydrolysing)